MQEQQQPGVHDSATMSAKAAPQSMESVREVLLQALEASPQGELASLRAFCKERGLEYKVADGVCRGLAAASYTVIKDVSKPCLNLTDEARGYLETGSPEFCFLASVPEEGKLLKELQAEGGKMAKLGFAKCMMRRWVKQDKTTGMINRNVEGDVEDVVTNQLKAIAAAPPTDNAAVIGGKDLKDLKKRNLVKEVKITTLVVTKGPRFSTTFKKQVADLTREMLEGSVPLCSCLLSFSLVFLRKCAFANTLHLCSVRIHGNSVNMQTD